jgi:hypothetical protein
MELNKLAGARPGALRTPKVPPALGEASRWLKREVDIKKRARKNAAIYADPWMALLAAAITSDDEVNTAKGGTSYTPVEDAMLATLRPGALRPSPVPKDALR